MYRSTIFTQNWGDRVDLSFVDRNDGSWVIGGCFLVAVYAFSGISKYTFDIPHVEPTSYPFVYDFPLIEHRVYPNFYSLSEHHYYDNSLNTGIPNIEFSEYYQEEAGYDIVYGDISGITFTETGIECPDVWDNPTNFPFKKPLNWLNQTSLVLPAGFWVYYYPDKTKTEALEWHISSNNFLRTLPEYGELCLRIRQSGIAEQPEFMLVVKTENEEYESTESNIIYRYGEFDTEGMFVIYPDDTEWWSFDVKLPSYGLGYGELTELPLH